ncbi:MAG: thioredoxin family protein [Candidatus Omnitrophica bacterium]|nr:thioredoxin family protein [Candidatus Omnitrophota bacterium]
MWNNHILQFLGFFIAGLAVNLTPCVYPMLTVTASLFKPKQDTHETLQHSFLKALAYFLGIAVMYSSLGYFAASTGKIFGSILQNSFVLGGVALMMFLLALSMFGHFELRVSSELLNLLSKFRQVNYIGLFVSGMLVGVFAAPCIGPPVLGLLAAVTDNGNPQFGLTAFFIFSCGLGLPYLLLGTFSGLVSKLPKAGNWLKWVERIFGIILLGFAVFYLSLALHLHPPSAKASSIPWQVYSIERVKASVGQHKPVIIDFYADWCISCHELERTVFSNPQVIADLSRVTTLRVDVTNMDDPKANDMIEKYHVIGLPTVIFLDSRGHEIKEARVEGERTKNEFVKSVSLLR